MQPRARSLSLSLIPFPLSVLNTTMVSQVQASFPSLLLPSLSIESIFGAVPADRASDCCLLAPA